jgi:D-3-phosphoglycerate dehydrogenase
LSDAPKFVITDHGFPTLDPENQVIQEAGGKLAAFQCRDEADVIRVAKDADALLVQFAPITRAVIQNLPVCRVIVRYGIGTDNVDLEAARNHGIVVCNVPDYCIDEVADHTLALALSLARQIPAIDWQVRHGVWNIVPPRPMFASRQMTFVTIGYGRIARAVLKRAQGFKFNLATCDPYLSSNIELPDEIQNLRADQALKTADILSLHLPLSKETHHFINAGSLSAMKSTAFLVNTARGGLVDTSALADALNRGQIAGAALDVFEKEPIDSDQPLKNCANALLTSHVGWYSESSGPKLQRMVAEEAVRAIRKEPLQNRIV